MLGASWMSLGQLLGALGRLLATLGRILDASWALLGVSWSVWDGSWAHFHSRERSRPRFWRVRGRVGLGFGGLEGHVSACILYRLTVVAPCFYLRSNHALSFTCAFGASPPVRRSVHRTSAASRRESRACQTVVLSLLYCLPLRLAFRIRLQIPSHMGLPPSFYSFPRTRTDRRTSPAICS